MEYNISKFKVDIVKEKYDKNDVDKDIIKDNRKAVVTRYFKNGLSEKDEYAVIDNEKLYKKIEKGEELNLKNCYIKDFTLRKYEEKNQKEKGSKIIINKINAQKSFWDGEEADLSCANYTGDIDFRFSVFNCKSVKFDSVTINNNETNFLHSVFHNTLLDFQGAKLKSKKRIVFAESYFTAPIVFGNNLKVDTKNLDFSRAKFFGDRNDFDNGKFNVNEIIFEECYFEREFNLYKSTFIDTKEIIFKGSEFKKGDFKFFNLEFKNNKIDKINFSGADFGEGNVRFQLTNDKKVEIDRIDFYSIRHNGNKFDFEYNKLINTNLNFQFMTIKNGCFSFQSNKLEDCELNFSQSKFYNSRLFFRNNDYLCLKNNINYFRSMRLKNTDFYILSKKSSKNLNFDFNGSYFEKEMFFRIEKVNELNLQAIDSKQHSIFNINEFNKIDMCGSHFNNLEISFSKFMYDNFNSIINIKDVFIYGKMDFSWEKENIKKLIYNNKDSAYKDIANQFRILKENYRKLGQYEWEDKAYCEFKKNQLLTEREKLENENKNKDTIISKIRNVFDKTKWWFKKKMFQDIGGFGTEPVTVLKNMLGFVLFFSNIYYVCYLFGWHIIKFNKIESLFSNLFIPIYYSAITFLTIGYGDINPTNFVGQLLSGIEGFIGLFLMSYFTVAFVRKVLR